MNLGKNIKIIRASKSISQKDLAKQLGITQTYLSLIENDNKTPSLTLVERICQVLETPLHLIFTEISLG